MKTVTKIIIPAGILVIAAIIMYLLIGLKEEAPKKPPQIQTKIVETVEVKLQAVEAQVSAFGRSATSEPVLLYSEVSGTLEQGTIPFKPSQNFSKGDIILKIDDRQARYQLNSAKSELLTALATVLPEIKVDFPEEYPVWQEFFDGCQFDKKLKELPETENEKIRLYMARFNVYKLYFNVKNLEIHLSKHYYKAPFAGSIVRTDVRVGSAVRVGMLLGEIINIEEMEIAVPLEVKNVAWIEPSKTVSLKSEGIQGEWEGKISRVGSSIDEKTQTVDVFLKINNGQSASLLNGVFLEADIPGKIAENAFAIPPRALYEDSFVYLIENGKLVRRNVKMLRREAERVIISDGLQDGDILVTELLQGVTLGMPAESKAQVADERRN